ncbi:MAG TPA: methyltransferase domain-containing protein [Pyrinomonadaceae bacterium]|jgi:SAM-dependent methyltransferase
MPTSIPISESRSPERLREHYLIERELADRLRSAGREERLNLYAPLYDELFRRVLDHPQLTRKADAENRASSVAGRMSLLRRFLNEETVYLEVGPGDCALALEVARQVKQVYAVDVSEEITGGLKMPSNFRRVISDGCSIPVPVGEATVAFSDQLMEHLHPEDALEQLRNIYCALREGGSYICITPNSLSGPHDVSEYFDEVATGFHLKEYTVTELAGLFRATGFRKVRVLIGARGRFLGVPASMLKMVEAALGVLPRSLRKRAARGLPLRLILGINLIATK